MKTIKLIKDKIVSVRINSMTKDALRKQGYSVQKFLDEKLAEKFEINTTIKAKK